MPVESFRCCVLFQFRAAGRVPRCQPQETIPLLWLVSACRVCMDGRTDAVEKLELKLLKMNYLKYCTVFEVILFSDFVIRSLPSASPLAQGSATAPWATWEQTSRPVGRRLRNGALSIAACTRNPNDFSYIRLLPKVGLTRKSIMKRNFPSDHTGANIAHSDTSVAQCCPADCNFPRYLNYFAYFRLLPKAGFVKNPADFTNFRLGCQLSVAPMVATETFFVGHTGTKGSFR